MGGFGLGGLLEQFTDLKLGELLDTPPPGFDEAVAIAKVATRGRNGSARRPVFFKLDSAPARARPNSTPGPACPRPPQVQQFVKREEFARFTRIVFDTAPTGHTLRLLTSAVL